MYEKSDIFMVFLNPSAIFETPCITNAIGFKKKKKILSNGNTSLAIAKEPIRDHIKKCK